MRQCSLNTVGHTAGGVTGPLESNRIVYTQRCSLLQSLDGLPNQSIARMNESLGCNGCPFPLRLRRRTDPMGLCPCALVPWCPPVGRTAVAEAAMRVNGAALFAVHWRHGTGPRSLVCGDEADDYDDLAELQREAQGVHLSTALYLSGTA
jgi:hypothetical protein